MSDKLDLTQGSEDWKRCGSCKEVKKSTEFAKHCKAPDGLQHYCKSCNKVYREKHREHLLVYAAEWRRKNKESIKEKQRQYYLANKETLLEQTKEYRNRPEIKKKRKERERLNKFGITAEEINQMKQIQNGLCACCRQKPNSKGFCVDHCHTTGTVRGLLCNKCNLGIGLLGDTLESLLKAVDYLSKSEAHGKD